MIEKIIEDNRQVKKAYENALKNIESSFRKRVRGA